MSDWSSDLQIALASGDAAMMQAHLARVPKDIIQRAVPAIERMARNSVANGELEEALTYYTQLISAQPHDSRWLEQRAAVHFKLDQLDEALEDAGRIVELRPNDAVGYRLRAEALDARRERKPAIEAYRRVLAFEPSDDKSKQRIRFLETELQKEALLKQALEPDAPGDLRMELPTPPDITFDPGLLTNPSLPDQVEQPMVDGLKHLLSRHGELQSTKDALARLEDASWISAWDAVMSSARGEAVLLYGSELGVLAARAWHHGAKRILAIESSPLNERIAGGVVHKNLLAAWHARHRSEIETWSDQQRQSSFESFAANIQVAAPESATGTFNEYRHFVFPNLDHSLLGTGIVKAVRKARSQGLPPDARITPACARVFAMPVQWRYEDCHFALDQLEQFLWSPYPQPLEASAGHWIALADPMLMCTIDFASFEEAHLVAELPATTSGRVNAIVYWSELDLGAARVCNATDAELRCIRAAVQYVDEFPIESGQLLTLRATVSETRLHFSTDPPATRTRSHVLPSWYVPMLMDAVRNDAFGESIARALQRDSDALVLDIGSGCGLLAMLAARAGASRVVGCEISPAIAALGKQIVDCNGFSDRIELINKDLRKTNVPADLPARADLAIFELFDCSMIGEGVLHYLAYAREHLLKPDARYVPLSGRIRAMVIEYRMDRILGVDVNLLNAYRFSPSFINVDADKLNYRPLTEAFDVFAFDFSSATPTPQEKELSVPVVAEGIAGAILFWFDLQMDESSWLSNQPGAAHPTHWKQGLQFMTEIQIARDASFPVLASHNGSSLLFRWKPDALAKDSFSALPRFDPRWWQQTKALEQQTRELLEHCMRYPDEYRKVAALAQRFAVDPARYDLNPTMAQRFAATFHGV